MKIKITEIQHFCTHDGPGLRTTVFLNGCPLSCKWCHNPEARVGVNQIFFQKNRCIGCGQCGQFPCQAHRFTEDGHLFLRENCVPCGQCVESCPSNALENTMRVMDTTDVLREIMKDRAFYGEKGGVTLSGGEPMEQGEAAIQLLDLCKQEGIHTAVETCGCFAPKYLEDLAHTADLLLFDVKDTNEERHLQNTGAPLEPILDCLFAADRLEIPSRLRCIIIEGVNAQLEHIDSLCRIADRLKHCQGIDLIPYHPMGQSKYQRLGLADTFDDKAHIPSDEKMRFFSQRIANR